MKCPYCKKTHHNKKAAWGCAFNVNFDVHKAREATDEGKLERARDMRDTFNDYIRELPFPSK